MAQRNLLNRVFGRQEPAADTVDPKKAELLSKYSLEYIEYAIEFEQTLSSLESQLHESDNAREIIKLAMAKACEFYGGDWVGFLEVDMELKIWAPYTWHNINPIDHTLELIHEFESVEILYRWITAMRDNTAIIVPDVKEIKDEYPDEYDVYKRLNADSVIAVPVTPRPTGFLVIRNPTRYLTRSSMLQMLAFVVLAIINEMKLMDSLRMKISPENIDNDTDIIVNLLGSMEIHTLQGVLKESDIKSQKIVRLIAYMILNRNRSIPPREIAEAIWPEEALDIETIGNNMRGLLFRLRQYFSMISPHTLIESTPNGYRINPNLNITTDYDQFDKYCNTALSAVSISDRIDMFKQALKLYKEKMLDSADGEHWLLLHSNHYSLRYIGMVNDMLKILADLEDFDDLHKYASISLEIDPTNMNAYYWLIYAMIHLGASEMARSEYEMAKRYLTEDEYKELVAMLRKIKDVTTSELFHTRDIIT